MALASDTEAITEPRKNGGDRGHDCSFHIKSPPKIALCGIL